MPVLGYGQVSSIAPNAIARGYEGIVQNLRQTGQEIAANVQRVQTNKQVTALGQEMATIDPYSPQFPQQMLAVATKYPMALADQRGQALMGVLGIAHKDYLAQKADERNFGQAVSLAGLQSQFRMNENAAKPGGANSRFKTVPGVGLVDLMDLDENGKPRVVAEATYNLNEGGKRITSGGEVIAEGGARTTASPFAASNGMVIDKTTGNFTPLPLNANQQAMLDQKAITEGRQQAIGQIKALDDDIARAITETRDTEDEGRLRDLQNRIDNARSRKDALLNALGGVPIQGPSQGAIDPLSTPTLGGLNGIQAAPVATPASVPMVPDAAAPILPPPGAIPSPQQGSKFVPGKVYKDRSGNRRVYTEKGWINPP